MAGDEQHVLQHRVVNKEVKVTRVSWHSDVREAHAESFKPYHCSYKASQGEGKREAQLS